MMSEKLSTPESKPDPKVFISYAWTNDDYKRSVIAFAERLANPGGVEVRIDAWDLSHGDDKFQYMEGMVTDPSITHVIMLFNPTYKQKADARAGGVGDEAQIITPELFSNTKQDKFVGIILDRGTEGSDPTPAFYKSRIYADLTVPQRYEEEFETLLRHLYGKPEFKRPDKSLPPSFVSGSAAEVSLGFKPQAINAQLHADKPIGPILRDTLEEAVRQLKRVELPEVAEGRHIDELLLAKLDETLSLRSELCEIFGDILRYSETPKIEEFRRFFEASCQWLDHYATGTPSSDDFYEYDAIRFFILELVLHFTAIAIQERQLNVVKSIFLKPLLLDGKKIVPVGVDAIFKPHLHHLICKRRKRLKEEGSNTNKENIQAQLLKDRLSNHLNWPQIVEAEVLLWLSSLENNESYQAWPWQPILMEFIEGNKPCKVFARAQADPEWMGSVVEFFGTDLEQLQIKAEEVTAKLNRNEARNGEIWGKYKWSWDRILSLSQQP